MPNKPEGEIVVPIVWEQNNLESPFVVAGHMLVNFDQDNFYVRFFQVVPPANPDQNMEIPSEIIASLVAKVAIPAGRMPSVIQALSDNAEKYQSKTGIELDWEHDEDAEDDSG